MTVKNEKKIKRISELEKQDGNSKSIGRKRRGKKRRGEERSSKKEGKVMKGWRSMYRWKHMTLLDVT